MRDTARDENWNRLVLSLLQQAGLIRLEERVDAREPEGINAPVGIRVLRADMFTPEWEAAWHRVREADGSPRPRTRTS